MAVLTPLSTPTLPLPAADGVTHRFVRVRGATIHVAEAGSGPPLVLLHGWPQHWWAWRGIIGPLASRFHVICPDVRGLGWSGGSDGSFLWDSLAADLFALVDTLGYERVRLVGHDWGVAIGYRACLLRPDRFEKFVAVALVHPWQPRDALRGFVRPDGPWHLPFIAMAGRRAVTRLNLAERGLRAWRHAGHFSADEAAVYLGAVRRPSAVAATVGFARAAVFSEGPRALREARFERLAVPTMHVYGAYDPLARVRRSAHRPYSADMTVEVIPNCGHFVPEEAPDALLERLEAFL